MGGALHRGAQARGVEGAPTGAVAGDEEAAVFARVAPEQKLRLVRPMGMTSSRVTHTANNCRRGWCLTRQKYGLQTLVSQAEKMALPGVP